MLGFLKGKLVSFVVTLLLSQIPIFKEDFSFEKFKETIKKKVPEIVPGTWLDGAAVSVCLQAVYVFEEAVTQDLLKKVVNLLIAGQFEDAWKVIQQAVIELVNPGVSLASVSEKDLEVMFEQALAVKMAQVDTAQA